MTALARAVAGRGSTPLGIGGDAHFHSACAAALPGPALPEALTPLALIVPGQLLTEALARRRGLDPDQPRTLSKITQTSG
jgi:glucosamine--fructose-6-phosphate aminotransferase (isomerizing)